MNRYGQAITWSTIAAPRPFTGTLTAYSYREQRTRLTDEDESGDHRALILHSKKADLNWSAKVTEGSTDFLDLSAGAAITLTGIAAGVILATRAVERWVLMQPKTISCQATHYPDMVQADPASAGVALDAFTPDQAGLGIVTPSGLLTFSTHGLGHASGVVHELELTQELQITEDDPSPDGKLLGAADHGYMRTIRLMLLATGAIPATGTTLAITGAPEHAADYLIESAQLAFASKRGKMYDIGAVWIPPLTAG